jgi:Flp pilus assembly protein TadD
MRKRALFLAVAGTATGLLMWQVFPLAQILYSSLKAPQTPPELKSKRSASPQSGAQLSRSEQRAPEQKQVPHTDIKRSEYASEQLNAYAHFQMGNYEGAVNQLRMLLKAHPQDTSAKQNLATALLALGFYKLQVKEFPEAETAFDESSRLGNTDAQKALAGLKLRQGQLSHARELLEELSSSGTDPQSLRILIDLALSQDDLEQADDLLNRISERIQEQSDPTELKQYIENRQQRLAQKRTFLKSQEIVYRQGIEVSYSSTERKALAETVAAAIEEVSIRLNQLLGPLPAHARLRAWLVPSNDFRQITGAPPWAAAVFDGYIRIPVGRSPNNAIVARLAQHETTHAYMYAFCGDTLPSWIGEGLAQTYENRSAGQSQSDLLRSLGRKALLRVEPEIDRPFTEAASNLVSRLYARSHLLVDAMSKDGGGVNSTWQRFLSAVCVQRRPLPAVLQEQFNAQSAQDLWTKYYIKSESQ